MPEVEQQQRVNSAFSKQSIRFDEEDDANEIIQQWRHKIYKHVNQFLKPNSKILELNAGTGIDAIHFARLGHRVHATDASGGMITQIKRKIEKHNLAENISVQQISFDRINEVSGTFDFVFSNFGGLNCIDELQKVTTHLPGLLREGAFVTWVIMPKIAPWEWSWILKGKFSDAFRRFSKNGANAHLEGENFITYYHSYAQIKKAFGQHFELKKVEGIGIISPPPSAQDFVKRFSTVTAFLSWIDERIRMRYPFNRWGDHLIITLQRK